MPRSRPASRLRFIRTHRDLQAVMVRAGDRTVCYISDLIPTSHHLDPTWVMGYDLYPLESINNRHRFYKRAIPGEVAGGLYPRP